MQGLEQQHGKARFLVGETGLHAIADAQAAECHIHDIGNQYRTGVERDKADIIGDFGKPWVEWGHIPDK